MLLAGTDLIRTLPTSGKRRSAGPIRRPWALVPLA